MAYVDFFRQGESMLFRGMADLNTFCDVMRKQGVIGALRTAREAFRLRLEMASDQRFDRKYGLDTCGLTLLSDLSINSKNIEHCVYHVATPVTLIESILNRLPGDLKDFVFVDFGSGKGRILLIASRLPFKRIIGVEFAKELHEIAKHNIGAYKSSEQSCFEIESSCVDAREFEIPSDKCVLFFYRPFSGPVFQQVLDRIVTSYHANSRKMYLIYCCPFSGDPFKPLDFVKKIPLPTPLLDHMLGGGIGAVLYETRDEAST